MIRRFTLLAQLVLLLLSTVAEAGVSETTSKVTMEDRAKEFVTLFYPRSHGKEMRVGYSGGLLVITVPGLNLKLSRDVKTATERASESFAVGFSFYKKDDSIAEVHANNINHETLTAIRDLVDKNPQWSEKEVYAALRRAGARFTPNNRQGFMRTLPMREITQMFGPVRLESVNFSVGKRQALKEGEVGANLVWYVRVRSRHYPKTEYSMVFEPFDGALTYLSRTVSR